MQYFENINDLNEYYKVNSKHSLIDIQKYSDIVPFRAIQSKTSILGFYKISLITNFEEISEKENTKVILNFVEPGQKYYYPPTKYFKGYQILLHSDIFKEYLTEKSIIKYNFFSYNVSKSLVLTKDEENTINFLITQAWNEFNNKDDDFSTPIVLSYISTLLNLAERFHYHQFKTRKTMCNRISNNFFKLMRTYYSKAKHSDTKQPTLLFFAEKLNVTPNYLSDVIRHHTGKSALSIIHEYIIQEAKKLLISTNQTISEISFNLGFEYPNYFSRLFKKKTSLSPSDFRKSVKSI